MAYNSHPLFRCGETEHTSAYILLCVLCERIYKRGQIRDRERDGSNVSRNSLIYYDRGNSSLAILSYSTVRRGRRRLVGGSWMGLDEPIRSFSTTRNDFDKASGQSIIEISTIFLIVVGKEVYPILSI